MTSRHRFYLPPSDWASVCPALTGDEAHHCSRVFRHRPGDAIEVFDGAGVSAPATIVDVAKTQVRLRLASSSHTPPLRPALILAPAIAKGKAMELIIQKAVECGAAEIHPLITGHAQQAAASLDRKPEKWQRLALEACKQCGQNHLPTVAAPAPIEHLIRATKDDLRLVTALDPRAKPLRECLPADPPERIVACVGPEGDWSADELDALAEASFHFLDLGPLVLRSETAAICTLGILRQHYLHPR